MSPWKVETDALTLRRLGKLGEELGELQAVVSRCIIQGINETDPSSRKTNKARMEEEMADVLAQMKLTHIHFDLNTKLVRRRRDAKILEMAEWEKVLKEAGHRPYPNYRY